MHILLKDILKEVVDKDGIEKNPLKVQFYCDMDGVLVDMDSGFKEISGGLSVKEFSQKNKNVGIFSLINAKEADGVTPKFPNFWLNLKPMPDADKLWSFIKNKFKDPSPIILTAGDRRKSGKNLTPIQVKDMERLVAQKTQWARNFTKNPSLEVRVANIGTQKPKEIKQGMGENVAHFLLDDTPENISVWTSGNSNRNGLIHTGAAETEAELQKLYPDIK